MLRPCCCLAPCCLTKDCDWCFEKLQRYVQLLCHVKSTCDLLSALHLADCYVTLNSLLSVYCAFVACCKNRRVHSGVRKPAKFRLSRTVETCNGQAGDKSLTEEHLRVLYQALRINSLSSEQSAKSFEPMFVKLH